MKLFKILTIFSISIVPNVALSADMDPSQNNYGLSAELWGGANILGISKGDANDSGLDKSFGLLGGRASMVFDSSSSLMTQLSFEGQGNFLSTSASDDDQVSSAFQGTAHLMTDSGLGILGGGGVVGFQDEDSVNFYFAGLEYNADFNGGHMLLQAGGFGSKVTDGTSQYTFKKAWFARVAPEVVTSHGFSLGLNAAYIGGEIDGDKSSKLINWGVKLSQALEDSPTTIFLGYDGVYVDGAGGRAGEHTVMAGLRFELGGSSNKEISNPGVARWVGVSHRTD